MLTRTSPHTRRLANWRRRTQIIDYCVDVLDTSHEDNKLPADEANGTDLRARRKAQAELYSADIKVSETFLYLVDLTRPRPLAFGVQRTQLYNEQAVETIVRERSVNGMDLASLTFAPASL